LGREARTPENVPITINKMPIPSAKAKRYKKPRKIEPSDATMTRIARSKGPMQGLATKS